MYGLIVKQPYAEQLVNGTKIREFRTKPLPKHLTMKKIYILNKGSALGTVIFLGYKEGYKHSNTHTEPYIWIVWEAEQFNPPLKYKHKNGCVTWIKDVEIIPTVLTKSED